MRVLFLNPPFHPRFSREQRSPAVTKSGITRSGWRPPLELPLKMDMRWIWLMLLLAASPSKR